MRISSFLTKTLAALAVIGLCGCSGMGSGEGSAFAKSSRQAQARAALEKTDLTPKNLFSPRIPKRQIHSLAVTGDSLSIGLANEMGKSLAGQPGLAFASLGKVSSGLARPDFFDWDRNMEHFAARYRPDAVLVMIGTNDNKHLRQPDGSQILFGTPEWDRAYTRSVLHLVDIIRAHNPSATIFWLGCPVMADEDLSRDLRHINTLLRKAMASARDCHYVDTWPLFATPGGHFALSKPDVEDGAALRARDGIHLTTAGAQALAGRCLDELRTRVTWDEDKAKPIPLAEKGI